MPRSSRHKSHKQHKHSSRDGRNYSDSEDGEGAKEVKAREEPAARSGGRVSREPDSGEKRKAKDLAGPGNGVQSGEHGSSKRRKDGSEPAVGSDRWDGREGARGGGLVDSEKTQKTKASVDGKGRSSRRQEGAGDRKDEILAPPVDVGERKKDGSKVDFDRKGERDSSRKDSYDHKDGKEKERGGDREKKAQDGRRSDKSVDGALGSESEHIRRKDSYMSEDSRDSKREVENSEWQGLENAHVEKEHEKRARRKADHKDSKNYEVTDTDDRRHSSSREDHVKHQRHKDEGHKCDSYKERRVEEYEKDGRLKYENHRDKQSVREHSIERSGGKLVRDESRLSDSNHKKVKLQLNDYEDNHFDDGDVRYSDHKRRKRSPDDGVDYSESKSRDTKEQHTAIERITSSGNKLDFASDGRRSEPHRKVPIELSPNNDKQKKSPSSSIRVGKVHDRHSSKGDEAPYMKSLSEETQKRSSPKDASDRVLEPSFMEKSKNDDIKILRKVPVEDVASLPYNRSPKPMERSSPIPLLEKSPTSSSGDRKYLSRAGLKRSLDNEEVGQGSGFRSVRGHLPYNDRAQDISLEKGIYDRSQDRPYRESTPAGSSFVRTGVSAGGSHSSLPPPFPSAGDSPLVMAAPEDDYMNEMGERKQNHRYKRSGEPSNMAARGSGSNSWKGISSWPSPMPNGFVPYQHGPGPTGFLPPFPRPLFGVRPPRDLNHGGVTWHDPTLPFGWQNPPDEACPPLLHGWDGSNGVIGDEAHIYRRQSWEQNRHLLSNKGWELNSDAWRAQNGNLNADTLTPKKEYDYSSQTDVDRGWSVEQSNKQVGDEENHLEHSSTESIDVKQVIAVSTEKKPTEPSLSNDFDEKKPDISCQRSIDDNASMLGFYLSKIDISMDLLCPELYKQCVSVVKEEVPNGFRSTTKDVKLEDDIEFWKHPHYNVQKLLFPTTTESIFEKTMALYKQQKEVNVETRLSSVPKVDLEKVSIAENVKVVMPSDNFSNAMEQEKQMGSPAANSPSAMEQEKHMGSPSANSPNAMEQERHMGSPSANSPNAMELEEQIGLPIINSPNAVGRSKQLGLLSDNSSNAMEHEDKMGIDGDNSLVPEFEQHKLPQTSDEFTEHPAKDLELPDGQGNSDTQDDPSVLKEKDGESIGCPDACVAMLPEPIECTVNLSRIHHSPENTH